MTAGRARRWFFLALLLVATLPFFAMLLLLAFYFAPDAVFGWPWTDGLAAVLGPLTLIAGPLVVVKPLARLAGKRRAYLAAILVGSVVLGGAFVPASLYLHLWRGTPEPASACGEYFTDTSRCVGRDRSMLQGRWGIRRGQGVPRRELCDAFLAAPPGPTTTKSCDLSSPSLWSMTDCARYGAPSDWHCRYCVRRADTGDVYRTFVGFERSCGRAMMAKSTNEQITFAKGDVDPVPGAGG